ncbi:unnamed protein product [Pedinophyceae sp. YPF-701]|nr:unnamed protein product [Pedinophyceae sp. YPF-701]
MADAVADDGPATPAVAQPEPADQATPEQPASDDTAGAGTEAKKPRRNRELPKETPTRTMPSRRGKPTNLCERPPRKEGTGVIRRKRPPIQRKDVVKEKAELIPISKLKEMVADRRKKRNGKERVDQERDTIWAQLLRRTKGQITRLGHEYQLLQAYQAEGWRGSKQNIAVQTNEIQRAEAQLTKSKEMIRDCLMQCEEAGGLPRLPPECFDENGDVDVHHLKCSICGKSECTEENDLVLCDGHGCDRAYHMDCLSLAEREALAAALRAGEELEKREAAAEDGDAEPAAPPSEFGSVGGESEPDDTWFCGPCDARAGIIEQINAFFGTEYDLETKVGDIFTEDLHPDFLEGGAESLFAFLHSGPLAAAAADDADAPKPKPKPAGGTGLLLGDDLPDTDDSEDEDFNNVDSDPTGESEGRSDADSGSDAGGQTDDDDEDPEEVLRGLAEEGEGAAGGGGGESGEERGRGRRRGRVDYALLAAELFHGHNEHHDDTSDGEDFDVEKERKAGKGKRHGYDTDTEIEASDKEREKAEKKRLREEARAKKRQERAKARQAQAAARGERRGRPPGASGRGPSGREVWEEKVKALLQYNKDHNGKLPSRTFEVPHEQFGPLRIGVFVQAVKERFELLDMGRQLQLCQVSGFRRWLICKGLLPEEAPPLEGFDDEEEKRQAALRGEGERRPAKPRKDSTCKICGSREHNRRRCPENPENVGRDLAAPPRGRLGADGQRRLLACTICGSKEHNRRRCPQNPENEGKSLDGRGCYTGGRKPVSRARRRAGDDDEDGDNNAEAQPAGENENADGEGAQHAGGEEEKGGEDAGEKAGVVQKEAEAAEAEEEAGAEPSAKRAKHH